MTDVLTEVRFWSQVMTDAKRTVHCPPDLESRIKGWVDARGMGGLVKVITNPMCPPNQVFVIDEAAIEASFQQSLHRYWKRGIR